MIFLVFASNCLFFNGGYAADASSCIWPLYMRISSVIFSMCLHEVSMFPFCQEPTSCKELVYFVYDRVHDWAARKDLGRAG